MKYRGDAGLLREAVEYVGLNCGTIYSDGNKGTRRLKLYRAHKLFNAAPAVQEMFMERLKHNFGNRVVKYHEWISSSPYDFQSFVLVITEDEALQAERKAKYAAGEEKRQAKWRARYAELCAPVATKTPEPEEEPWVPSQEHQEAMYLKGYQEARNGESCHYAPGVNCDLWNKGATAFYSGKELFA